MTKKEEPLHRPFTDPSLPLRISSELWLRASAQDSTLWLLTPHNDEMREKPPFSIGNFRNN